MVQCSSARLDASFAALSDITRRGVLEQLGRADASITDLAVKFDMTLTGMKKRWWVPTSMPMSLRTCEMDVRVGGKYRLVFGNETTTFMEVFGKYLEVTPPSRLVWTNEEGDEGGAVTTVTFEDKGGQTVLVIHDLSPSKKALEDAVASGSTDGLPEQLEQLDEFLAAQVASVGRA
jgi:uncharacterized protein YndB with AHSA1/START domain